MAQRRKKKLKSWQRRRRRRAKRIFRAALFCVLIIVAVLLIKATLPYEKVDLSDYATYSYGGYNTRGSVDVTLNEELLSNLMQRLRTYQDEALIKFNDCTSEDYNAFYNSINVTVAAPEYLSNGSMYSYTVNYDEELAKKIKLKVTGNKKEVMANGLVTATVISLDQVFSGISFTYEGISPGITAIMNNNTTNPYLADITYSIEGEKETYQDGDVIRVRADYDESICLEKHFVIDAPTGECYKDYIVESGSHYIRSVEELPQSVIQAAITAANAAFTSKTAKEYGVRVFFEAGIAPVYVNKESTFEWSSYAPISAYLKIANDDIAGKNSNNYNDLDIVYNCVMRQANGESTNVEAVVRFRDIVVNSDGSLVYDFNNATISSASHFDARIKKNVITNYEGNYTIEKLKIN